MFQYFFEPKSYQCNIKKEEYRELIILMKFIEKGLMENDERFF